MENTTSIDLGKLKDTNAAKAQTDALVEKINALRATENAGKRAGAIVYIDNETNETMIDALVVGNPMPLIRGLCNVITKVAKGGSKNDNARVSLLLYAAFSILKEASKAAHDPELSKAVALIGLQAVKYVME